MAMRGITVRAEKLSKLLKGVGDLGPLTGADKVLVTSKSTVYRIINSGRLKFVGTATALGSMVRNIEQDLPQYRIVPVDEKKGEFTYARADA